MTRGSGAGHAGTAAGRPRTFCYAVALMACVVSLPDVFLDEEIFICRM